MVASAENVLKSTENVLKSTENNSKSCEKPLNVRHDTVFLHTYLTEVRMLVPHALSGRAASMRFWAFSPYFNHLRNLS